MDEAFPTLHFEWDSLSVDRKNEGWEVKEGWSEVKNRVAMAFTFIAESRVSGYYGYGPGRPPLFVPRDVFSQPFQSI